MGLRRAWMQELSRASLAALLAPVAVAVAVAAVALSGGFGAFRALGQAFTGPALSSTHIPAPPVFVSGSVARSGPAASPAAPAQASGPASAAPRSSPTPTTPSAQRGSTTAQPPTPITHRPAPRRPPAGTTTGSGAPPASPPAPAAPPPVVGTAVGVGTSVTSQLPGPAGTVGTSALETAGAVLGGVLGPHGPLHALP